MSQHDPHDPCRLCYVNEIGLSPPSMYGVCVECATKVAEAHRDAIIAAEDRHREQQFQERRKKALAKEQERDQYLRRVGWTDQLKQPTEVVYYVAIGDHIKIGYSGNLRERLRGLRVPVDDLLAVEMGGRNQEQARHAQFDHLRITKRWENFRRGQDLLNHIAGLREANGVPTWLTVKRGRHGPITVRRADTG